MLLNKEELITPCGEEILREVSFFFFESLNLGSKFQGSERQTGDSKTCLICV